MRKRLLQSVFVAFLCSSFYGKAQPCGYSITESFTDVTCFGACDGTAKVEVSGGVQPLSYDWFFPGENNAEIKNLCPGTYGVKISDALNCDSVYIVEITEPEELEMMVASTNQICEKRGEIDIESSGGTPPYRYLSSGSDTLDISQLKVNEGVYLVTTIDNNKCTDTASVVVLKEECVVPEPAPAFSPNNDGINEVWTIVNFDQYPNIEVLVFDRWGQVIKRLRSGDKPWGGVVKGVPVPDATYYYVLYFDIRDKSKGEIHGSVSVVR